MHLISFVRGLSVGFVLGVLFAPDKGASTRRKLSSMASDIKEDLDETTTNIGNAIADKVKEIKSKTQSVVNRTKEGISEIATAETGNP